ncbi:MAG: hypothetical protein LBR92_02565 [Puniceicoccales bacterium]|jgi:hypothetical protein|nr:hypothetical protein [Puniceicoccales bacterium]
MRQERIGYAVFVDGKPVNPRMDVIGTWDDWDIISRQGLPKELGSGAYHRCLDCCNRILKYALVGCVSMMEFLVRDL